MVVCGLKVTVLCALGGFEVGDGMRGDVSVEAEARAITTLFGLAKLTHRIYKFLKVWVVSSSEVVYTE